MSENVTEFGESGFDVLDHLSDLESHSRFLDYRKGKSSFSDESDNLVSSLYSGDCKNISNLQFDRLDPSYDGTIESAMKLARRWQKYGW